MLPRKYRLHRNRDYTHAHRRGRSFTSQWLKMVYAPNGMSTVRVGFVVSNAVAKRATVRNRLKRQLRSAAASQFASFPRGFDIIFIVKSAPAGAAYHAIVGTVMALSNRLPKFGI